MKNKLYICILLIVIAILSPLDKCFSQNKDSLVIKVGAERIERYFDLLKGKKVGVVANQTSIIGKAHLVDSLIALGVNLRAIYCPEHGFRGEAEAGAIISSSIDTKTQLPIISLYGNNKKPSSVEIKKNDIIVFDLQDVGCRFYTYISTLHYVMEACAENNIPLIVLDRPNPNAYYIDGPVLKDTTLVSFVGMHPVPIVYGMTIGEYAKMINGEGWIGTSNKRVIGEKGKLNCNLIVISLENYTHNTPYSLPVFPSPNLKTDCAIQLYPSICWFEGTPISVGRGTDTPFEIIGYPDYRTKKPKGKTIISFTPKVIKGVSDNPPYKNQLCRGLVLECVNKGYSIEDNKIVNIQGELNISYLIEMYNSYPDKDKFFQPFFDKLSGSKQLKEYVRENKGEEFIRKSWKKDIEEFEQVRKKYLLYN